MTKKEEKAIETLKEVASDDYDTLGYDISPKMAQNIVNFIEKQQKEIDKLKKDKDILYGVIDEKNNDIRVKINELKGLYLDNDDTFGNMRNYAVLILEELLEENK